MEDKTQGFPDWPQTPIPGLSLSAGGLLALADLSTVAQRTALTGGSSWLDSLLLVPGLHYQQAADELARRSGLDGGGLASVEGIETGPDGRVVARTVINNAATVQFLQRVGRVGEVVTLDVGAIPRRVRSRAGGGGKSGHGWRRRWRSRQDRSEEDADWGRPDDLELPDLGWLSHVLYLAGPVLTIAALVMLILLQDWWALGCICALMLSRILNIWVIKQRAQRKSPAKSPPPPPPPRRHSVSSSTHTASSESGSSTASSQLHRQQRRRSRRLSPSHNAPHHHHSHHDSPLSAHPPQQQPLPPEDDRRSTCITVSLPGGREVCLRGTAADLRAVTADAWLRSRTHVEGYLEAAAKLLVYLVAAVSGNWSQAGAIVVMALLLLSAALLALSNAHARGLTVNGRVAAPPRLVKVAVARGRVKARSDPVPAAAADGDDHDDHDRDVETGGPVSAGMSGAARGVADPYYGGGTNTSSEWPGISAESSDAGMCDWAERGQGTSKAKDVENYRELR